MRRREKYREKYRAQRQAFLLLAAVAAGMFFVRGVDAHCEEHQGPQRAVVRNGEDAAKEHPRRHRRKQQERLSLIHIFLGANVGWGGFLLSNLLPVTLGNIVGGCLVGIVYRAVYLKKKG